MNAVRSRWQVALLVLLFGTALAVRLHGIMDPPLDFHPTKQYRSALTTRAYFFERQAAVPEWQREVARDNLRRIGVIVPTVQERAIACVYQLVGGEYLWLGRALSVIGWLIGGMFLFVLARRIASFEGAFLGTAFYLLLPFSVIASQSFQPDPLMVMAMVAAIYLGVRYHEERGAARFGLAALAAAVAVFIKPISIFLILAGWVGASLGFSQAAFRRRAFDWLMMAALSILPSGLYFLSRLALDGTGDWDDEINFLPGYVLQPEFWDNWLKRLRISLGITFVVAGVVGALLARSKAASSLLLSLWAGYLVMCISVAYKVSTHDYYHLPLIPIVALGMAQLVDSLLESSCRTPGPAWQRLALWLVVAVALFIAAGTSVQARRRVPDYTHEIATAVAIGELVGHSTRTVFLAQHYGRPLMYYGQLSGRSWPDRWDIGVEKLMGPAPGSAAERLNGMLERDPVDFFIVLDREEFRQQPELVRLLRERFAVYVDSDDFVIFDLRRDGV